MPQKVSISRWNIGESSQKSIGDFDQPLYNTSCRFLRNFIVSGTGKVWRRPGLEHHVEVTRDGAVLVPFYLPDDTLVLVFYMTGIAPAQTLFFDWYLLSDTGEPKKKFVRQPAAAPVSYRMAAAAPATTFTADSFLNGRPKEVNLHRLSYVQVDNYIYITHANMEDPWEIEFKYDTMDFYPVNFSTSNRSYYFDISYDTTPTPDVWKKDKQTDFNVGGGTGSGAGSPPTAPFPGWTSYTGREFIAADPNQGLTTTPKQTFKYLAGVTFSYERLVWTVGSYVHGSGGGDPLCCGLQYNASIPVTITEDPFKILSSDPFLYRASSDLGYENFNWLAGGPLLMGGANNGAWVLSNPSVGGIDTLNPLMYKATSNGAYWVPGKNVGDALLYFQRPGRQLNEFLYTNSSKNFVANNLTEYADHIFFDHPPVEMHVQRSPFNVVWILREDGTLVTVTYDRQKKFAAWAQHPQDISGSPKVSDGGSVVESMCMYSDGVIDQPVTLTKRFNASGPYHALELMDLYTPKTIGGTFVDAAQLQKLDGDWPILYLSPDVTNGHWIRYDDSLGSFADGQFIQFPGATRTEDGVPAYASINSDYIYGTWEIFDHDTALHHFRIKDNTGAPYIGIYLTTSMGATENAYITLGSARRVTIHPITGDTRFAHLAGLECEAVMDGSPHSIYVNTTATKFYDKDTIPADWSGVEADIEESTIYWNDIVIGRRYTSIFSPLVLKKQIHKGKINKIELEVFRSLGGVVGIGSVSLENDLNISKQTDLTYPVSYDDGSLYTGTIKPQIVGGFEDDPLWFIAVNKAVPFNITNIIYTLGAN